MNVKKSIIIIAGILITGFLISTLLSNQKKPMKRRPAPEKILNYKIDTVTNQNLSTTTELGGHLYAFDKVEVFAEVSGLLLNSTKRFKEGAYFTKDEPLVRIDDSVYKNNVLAQKSGLLNAITLMLPDFSIDFPERAETWRNYLKKFTLNQELPPLPDAETDQERYYIASKNIYMQYYQIKSMEATLAKYTISAPYDGVVTESMINPGTLVRMGQKLGSFTSTEIYELKAFANLDEIKHLRVGQEVQLTTDELSGKFRGKIERINQIIEKKSQTVTVYITTNNPLLKEGMYMTAQINSNTISNAFRVPRTAMVGKDQIWVVQDSVLKLQIVTVAAEGEDHIILQGLQTGTRILTVPPVKAYEGMKLNNTDRPAEKKPKALAVPEVSPKQINQE
ncbi:MAG: efflux RND transporter periplasmic adaptor subunit [bacterium]